MNTPGFSAGASLYKTSGHYRLTTGWAGGADVHLGLAQLTPPVPLPNGDGMRCQPHNFGCVRNPNYPEDPHPCCHLVRGSDCNERCIAPCECPTPLPVPSCGPCQPDLTSRTGYSQRCCYPPGPPSEEGLPVPILCFNRPCSLPTPPPPVPWPVNLMRQGFGPYAGKYVGTTPITVGTLVGVTNTSNYLLSFDYPTLTSPGCSEIAITLFPGDSMTGEQIARLYGLPNPPLPVTFVACSVVGNLPFPEWIPVTITATR